MEKMKTITMALVLMMGMATTSCVSTRDTVRINQVVRYKGNDAFYYISIQLRIQSCHLDSNRENSPIPAFFWNNLQGLFSLG